VRAAALEGRERELRAAMAACRDPGLGALVTGGGGVGKTSLAREVAARWVESGGAVTWIAATESARRFPFGAFAGAFGGLDAAEFGVAARQLVERLQHARPALLVIDDAHLLDDASAAVVHHLALAPSGVAMLATVADGKQRPPAVDALAKDGLLHHVELHPLEANAVTRVLERILGGHVEQATSDRLFELCGGNPLILRELIDAARAAENLAPRNGVWSLRGTPPTSPRLDQLVSDHLARLDGPTRRACDLLSLAEPLTLVQLSALVGRDAVAAAEDAGLVVIDTAARDQPEVRLAQALYAEVLRAGLGHVRTLDALDALATTLAAFPSAGPTEILKRALLRLEAGSPHDDDSDVFTEASRLARPDYPLAERFARAAIDAGAGFTAIDYLLDALVWQGRLDEAEQVAATIGDGESLAPNERSYFQLRWARILWWMGGERPPDTTVDVAECAGPVTSATVARQLGMAAASGRGPDVVAPALAVLAAPDTDDEARCWAAGAALIGLGGQGQVGRALSLADGALMLARQLADFNYRLLLSVVEIWIRRLAGDLTGAEARIEDLRQAAEGAPRPGAGPSAGLLTLWQASLTLTAGRARAAVPLLRDAAALLDDADFGGLAASAHFWLAEALALTGDRPSAATQLALGAEREHNTLDIFRPEQLLARAWTAVGIGDRKLAHRLIDDAGALAAAQGQQLVAVRIHHAGIRLGQHAAARRLLDIVSGVEGPFADSASRHARALLAADSSALLDAAERFAAHGANIEAVDAVAQAAMITARNGDQARSRQFAGRAASMADDLGGLDTPALRSVAPRQALTRRQHDVAQLAAAGLSNNEIADRLGVGVRTVESHLDAAYRRLGVSRRSDLPTFLTPTTPPVASVRPRRGRGDGQAVEGRQGRR